MAVRFPLGSFLGKMAILVVGGGCVWWIGWPEASRYADHSERFEFVQQGTFPHPKLEAFSEGIRRLELVVPERGRTTEGVLPQSRKATETEGLAEPVQSTVLDINEAAEGDLERLPGVGPVLAKRIIAYRKANGPFQHFEDLERVAGIGEKRMKQLRHLVTMKSRTS